MRRMLFLVVLVTLILISGCNSKETSKIYLQKKYNLRLMIIRTQIKVMKRTKNLKLMIA